MNQRAAHAAAAAVLRGDELAVAGAGLEHEIGDAVELLAEGRFEFLTQADVEGQGAGGLPVVLHVPVVDALLEGVHLLRGAAGGVDVAQQKSAERAAGGLSIESEVGPG